MVTYCLWMVLWLPSTTYAAEPAQLATLSERLAGAWRTEAGTSEEHWMTLSGGVMIGMNRDTSRPKRTFFEYMRLEQRPDGIYYVAQPLGREGTAFKLVKLDETVAVFENADHDFPQVITYARDGDKLCAWIGTVAQPRKVAWCWHKL